MQRAPNAQIDIAMAFVIILVTKRQSMALPVRLHLVLCVPMFLKYSESFTRLYEFIEKSVRD